MRRLNVQALLTGFVTFGVVLGLGYRMLPAVSVGLLVWAVGQRQAARRRRGR